MTIRFQIPETTNYSVKFLACRQAPSPYPRRERHKSASTMHMHRTSTCLKAIKHFLLKKHRQPNDEKGSKTSSHKSTEDRKAEKEAESKANLEWNAARRSAMDLGRRSHFPFDDSSSTLIERGCYRPEATHEHDFTRVAEVPVREESAMESPFREDIRTFGSVLAWMHSQGVNAAGYETTEAERRECREGRCRCLGPLARDV